MQSRELDGLFAQTKRVFKAKAYMSSALTNVSDTFEGRSKIEAIKGFNETIGELCDAYDIELYLPQNNSDPSDHEHLDSEIVYAIDRFRVSESDFLIALCDLPSLGVGQEIEIATSLGKPFLLLLQSGNGVSKMVKGSPSLLGLNPQNRRLSENRKVIEFSDEQDLKEKLKPRLEQLLDYLNKRKRLENQITGKSKSFSTNLVMWMRKRNVTIAQLAEELGVSEAYIRLLRMDKTRLSKIVKDHSSTQAKFEGYAIDQYTNPSLSIIRLLAKALTVTVSDLLGEEHTKTTSWEDVFYEEALKDNTVTLSEYDKIISEIKNRRPEFSASRSAMSDSRDELEFESDARTIAKVIFSSILAEIRNQ